MRPGALQQRRGSLQLLGRDTEQVELRLAVFDESESAECDTDRARCSERLYKLQLLTRHAPCLRSTGERQLGGRGSGPPGPESRQIVAGLAGAAPRRLELLKRLDRPSLGDPQPAPAAEVNRQIAFRAAAVAGFGRCYLGLGQPALLGEGSYQRRSRDVDAVVAAMRPSKLQGRCRVLLSIRQST